MLMLAVLMVVMVAAVAACGDDDEEATTTTAAAGDQPVEGGTFNIYISEPAFIDPVNLQESEGTQVGNQLFNRGRRPGSGFKSKDMVGPVKHSFAHQAESIVDQLLARP